MRFSQPERKFQKVYGTHVVLWKILFQTHLTMQNVWRVFIFEDSSVIVPFFKSHCWFHIIFTKTACRPNLQVDTAITFIEFSNQAFLTTSSFLPQAASRNQTSINKIHGRRCYETPFFRRQREGIMDPRTDGRTDGRLDGPMDQQTDGRTDPLIEVLRST